MPSINFEGSGHLPGPASASGRSYHLLPFSRPANLEPLANLDLHALRNRDNEILQKLNAAVSFISQRVAACGRCNSYFRTLRPGRPTTFAALWADAGLWINFFTSSSDFGVTSLDGRDVGLSSFCFDGSWRRVAATLVHELAHVAGAPGGSGASSAAEDALLHCLFPDLHNPAARG